MRPGAISRLEELRRPPEHSIEPSEQARRGPPEERRERRPRDVVPLLPDRQLVPPVVPPLTVQRLLHEDRERDRPAIADAIAEAIGGGRARHGAASLLAATIPGPNAGHPVAS